MPVNHIQITYFSAFIANPEDTAPCLLFQMPLMLPGTHRKRSCTTTKKQKQKKEQTGKNF